MSLLIKLSNIPDDVIPVLRSNDHGDIYYRGIPVKYITIAPKSRLNAKYRITTDKGQYRIDDGHIEIC